MSCFYNLQQKFTLPLSNIINSFTFEQKGLQMDAWTQNESEQILLHKFQSFEDTPFKLIVFSKPQTSFAILNQTLANLKDDTIKKYNTDTGHIEKQQKFTQFQIDSKPQRHQFCSFDQVLVPEPWYNFDSIFPTQNKSSMTQIRQRPNKLRNLSKSFYLSKNLNQKTKHQNHEFHHSSISSHDQQANKSLYRKSQKWKQKMNTFLTEERQSNAETFAKYNYTNEQKARMTLQHLVHRKKHLKMSKILKLKTHSFDTALEKQQKFAIQSKNLIQALQKFSNDNILRKSIDRAVDLLKKRTHSLTYNKSNSKRNFPKSPIDETSMKWLSCHKISINANVNEERERTSKQREISMNCFIGREVGIGKEKIIEVKQKSKVTFKPKRNYLVQGRKDSRKEQTQRYLINPAQSLNPSHYTSKKSSTKPKMIISQIKL